ncbi:cytochrome c oxidase assembly protein [Actinomadura scrupuli]|uniref:cytochrome c oxidase assembly protein n=1 Tax=Actinomadura scrupuli TaxID=559629 RepID=UPI003D98267F
MTAEARPGRDSALPSVSRQLWLAAAIAALVALAVVLRFGRTPQIASPEASTTPELEQAGSFAGSALPLARLAMNAAGTITVGWLLAVAVFLPSEEGALSTAGRRCLRGASVSAALWGVSALAVAVLSVSDLFGLPPATAVSGPELSSYLTEISQGRALLAVTAAATLLSVAAHVTRTPGGAGYLLILAVFGLLPPVFTGHAASSGDHALAVYSLAVHIAGAAVWVGGLVVLVAIATRVGDRLPRVVRRYSALAAVCLTAVGASGLVNAWIRLGGLHLGSRYGLLVVAKVVALAGLGALGGWHRGVSIPALEHGRRARTFLRIAAVEICVMAATMALATGLSQTAAPARDEGPRTPTEALLGFPLPGPVGVRAYLLDWRIDPLLFTLIVISGALYTAAVIRLRRDGVAWPLLRALAWFAGLAVLLLATCGGAARYSMVLFSAHMAQHLALSMLVPILLLLGAPVTLALRALRPGSAPGDRGSRELLLAVLHSRLVRGLTHPVMTLMMFIIGLYGFYFSPLFEASLRDHWLHSLMMLLFVVTGMCYLALVIGPGPYRPAPGKRLLYVLAGVPFHAVFGLAISRSDGVFAADWYAALARPWGASALHDQQFGGGLALILGELATLLFLLVMAWRWARDEGRGPGPAVDGGPRAAAASPAPLREGRV